MAKRSSRGVSAKGAGSKTGAAKGAAKVRAVPGFTLPRSPHITRLIDLALEEDLPQGDITSEITIAADARGAAQIVAREPMIICGIELIGEIFSRIDPRIAVREEASDGAFVNERETIATVKGSLRALLAGERTVLNFLQRLSGVATFTRAVVDAAENLMVLDTRKTVPGWRTLDKYAVRCGGAANHRNSLSDLVLIKNNHIDANGGDVRLTMQRALNGKPPYLPLEIEVRTEKELVAALDLSPDIIMLDNMDDRAVTRAVKLIRTKSPYSLIEVSGGITLKRLATLARIGVDGVSMGALTNKAQAVDISMRIGEE